MEADILLAFLPALLGLLPVGFVDLLQVLVGQGADVLHVLVLLQDQAASVVLALQVLDLALEFPARRTAAVLVVVFEGLTGLVKLLLDRVEFRPFLTMLEIRCIRAGEFAHGILMRVLLTDAVTPCSHGTDAHHLSLRVFRLQRLVQLAKILLRPGLGPPVRECDLEAVGIVKVRVHLRIVGGHFHYLCLRVFLV